jgi:hypothetical protein
MQVAGAAEVTTFAEILVVQLHMEMCKVAGIGRCSTDIVRFDIASDLYKISASLTSGRHNFLFESEVYFRPLFLLQVAC